MLVLSRRLHEKLILPDLHTSIQVVQIKPHMVRLGIQAPDEIRVLREEVPDRVESWGPAPGEEGPSPLTFLRLNQLLQKRLEMARQGLSEIRRQVETGANTDLATLDRLDEDLHLLQRRVQREVNGPQEDMSCSPVW